MVWTHPKASVGCKTVLILSPSNSFHKRCHFQKFFLSLLMHAKVMIYIRSIFVVECPHHLLQWMTSSTGHTYFCCLYYLWYQTESLFLRNSSLLHCRSCFSYLGTYLFPFFQRTADLKMSVKKHSPSCPHKLPCISTSIQPWRGPGFNWAIQDCE